MYSSACMVTDFNWIINKPSNDFDACVKLRYRQPDQKTRVVKLDEKIVRLEFKTKQKAVTIGQFAVIYNEEGVCFGGGRISGLLK